MSSATELTHALWTWLMGGKVNRFKVTSKGGHVIVSKTNFLIALAPYFFPVYAVLVVAVFVIGKFNLELGAIRGVGTTAAGGGLRVSTDVDVAHPEDRAIRHHAARVSVLGVGDFFGKHGHAAGGGAFVDGEGGGVEFAGLVDGIHGTTITWAAKPAAEFSLTQAISPAINQV